MDRRKHALNRQATAAHRPAVFDYVAAAERPHALAESVLANPLFLFWLIDALGHTASILEF